MPILRTRKWVEGQSLKLTLYAGKDCTSAVERRIYYKVPDGSGGFTSGFWDADDGVVVVNTNYLQIIAHDLKKGNHSYFPHAEFADNSFVSRSADPLQFYVKGIHEV